MGSVTPKNEFIISLGSKASSDTPMIANFLATNFLHKKYSNNYLNDILIYQNKFQVMTYLKS